MIEIVTDKDRNLKNLKQIGTPRQENKIYIENLAYAKIKEASYKEKRVFVLMGHTERMEGRYSTFIEAVIPVREVDFLGNTPRWNNSTWSEVFREIKRLYDDMIIVGWAVDIKGMSPKMTPELERVHREHFGGVHQLLFLLDSLEHEETFYIYKENKLVPKDGFFIYYRERQKLKAVEETPRIYEKNNQVDVDLEIEEKPVSRGGRYRQLMQEQKKPTSSDNGNLGLAMAVAMLVFVIGVGVYENRDSLFKDPESVETNLLQEDEKDGEASTDAEVSATESSTETMIPVEVVPGTEQE